MSPQSIQPWGMALKQWREQIQRADHLGDFRDRWMRLDKFSVLDLELKPYDFGTENQWLHLGLNFISFNKEIGRFRIALQNNNEQLFLASPIFSKQIDPDLMSATLHCLFSLALPQTLLNVVLIDDPQSNNSTLAIAEQYTKAGWQLDPKETQLVSDEPRQWIFRFFKP